MAENTAKPRRLRKADIAIRKANNASTKSVAWLTWKVSELEENLNTVIGVCENFVSLLDAQQANTLKLADSVSRLLSNVEMLVALSNEEQLANHPIH